MLVQRNRRDERLAVLLRNHGYRVEGNLLIQNGIRGFSSDRIFSRVRSIFDACEQLIPILCDAGFHSRWNKITAEVIS